LATLYSDGLNAILGRPKFRW